ncbi:MAG TPA: DUF389 domain-containing protein [Ignavibacteriaceae bacterium]|jgi:uncharacterized hydrophobic protein (TIGR00271 family)|nr:DUF389 domain-containing protein [Ignavibacteriaceae bacterium]
MKKDNILEKVLHYFNLDGETEKFDIIHETIIKDINFRGTNLWILMFAIIVASVGLNMNSTAVIIGAMLISPLMGPINGMGYSIATYNFPLLRIAVKNFTFAVIASLVASTFYFAITPVSNAHSELLARTSPTIYDVLIALFGGLAGIVAITSKQKGNVIPGVAIATALMPPLCTAGYGLATAKFNFFFGAFYLFTINTVFIAISSVIVSQVLRFPIRTLVDETQKQKVNRIITGVILVTIIPSIYFGYGLVEKEQFTENANNFIRNISIFEGNYLLKHEISAGSKSINLVYGGGSLTEAHQKAIVEKAKDFSLEKANISFKQGFSFAEFRTELNEVENLKAEINRLSLMLKTNEQKRDSMAKVNEFGKQLLSELKPLYPQILSTSYSETMVFTKDSVIKRDNVALVLVSSKNRSLNNTDRTKITDWLQARLTDKKVKIHFEEVR